MESMFELRSADEIRQSLEHYAQNEGEPLPLSLILSGAELQVLIEDDRRIFFERMREGDADPTYGLYTDPRISYDGD